MLVSILCISRRHVVTLVICYIAMYLITDTQRIDAYINYKVYSLLQCKLYAYITAKQLLSVLQPKYVLSTMYACSCLPTVWSNMS